MIAIKGKEGNNNCHIPKAWAAIMRQYYSFFIRFVTTGYGLSPLPLLSSCPDWLKSLYTYYKNRY